MLVTVVINNYNYGRFLPVTIKSVLEQSYKEVQVIVVDDGSTDNSREVITSFSADVLPVFKQNGGQASAFNAAIPHIQGELTFFLDADDAYGPDHVQLVVDSYRDNPHAALFFSQVRNWDGQHVVGDVRPGYPLLRDGDLLTLMKRLGFLHVFAPPTSGICLRSDVIRGLYPLPERAWRICADDLLVLGGAFYGPAVITPTSDVLYRVHQGNNWFGKRQNRVRKIQKVLNQYRYFYSVAEAEQIDVTSICPNRHPEILRFLPRQDRVRYLVEVFEAAQKAPYSLHERLRYVTVAALAQVRALRGKLYRASDSELTDLRSDVAALCQQYCHTHSGGHE